METIYLSLSAHVAVGTFFMKSPVGEILKVKVGIFQHLNISLSMHIYFCPKDVTSLS